MLFLGGVAVGLLVSIGADVWALRWMHRRGVL